jgi:hypothetical protein
MTLIAAVLAITLPLAVLSLVGLLSQVSHPGTVIPRGTVTPRGVQPGWLSKLRALVLLTDTLIKVVCMPLVALAERCCLRVGRTRTTALPASGRPTGRRGAPVAPTVRQTVHYFAHATGNGR